MKLGRKSFARIFLRNGIPLLAAMLPAVLPSRAAGQAKLDGQPVAAVRVLDLQGRILQTNLPRLSLIPGQPFAMDAERQSLKALYATGDFADIRTEAAETPTGLRIDFVVRHNFYNNVVRIEGIHSTQIQAAAAAVMNLPLGQVFRESAVQSGLARLADTLRDDGYYLAQSHYTLRRRPDMHGMDVYVTVGLSPRARQGQIQFHNESEFSNAKLLHQSKLESGDELSRTRTDNATERLRKFLGSANYLAARVSVQRGDYDAAHNSVPLTISVIPGLKVQVRAEGARIHHHRLVSLVPIYQEGSVDADLIQEGRRNIRDALESEGYFDATVNVISRLDPQSRTQVITYEINRGKQHKLVGYAFAGNKYFDDDLLTSRLHIQPASFASAGKFSPKLLSQDANSIKGLYIANGFLQAQVKTEVLDDYQGKTGNLFVHFSIVEGPQTRVAKLDIVGNRALSKNDLLSVVGSTPGQPYSDANVTSDRDNVLAFYFNEGFPDAQFRAEETAAGPALMNLTYRITEGPQLRVDQVYVVGYEYTRPGVIRRQVEVKSEEPLRQSDIVDTQRRLYDLGVFTRVAVAPQNPSGSDPDKNVVVDVDEGRRYTIGYGFGLEAQRLGGTPNSPASGKFDVSPLGIFEVSKSNVFGRAQTAALKLRASTLQYRGLLSYIVPDFFAREKFSLQLTAFADKIRDVQTFTATRYEGSAQVTENITRLTSLLYRYTFRHVLVDAASLQIPAEEIPLFSQPTLISEFGITWLRDSRDNPADASRGSFNNADFDLAAKSIGSSASFSRIFVQNSTFHPLGRSLVFARSARFGVEQTFSDTTENQIPLPERFFAGGGTTLRGFGLNQAGPRDPVTGFPIGGLAFLAFNQELRFPMKLPLVGTRLGGTVFYDAGNVFSDVNRITLSTSPVSAADLNYFSHTIGFGFRYGTPIGPVRLDLGYQLNPAQFSFINSSGVQQLARLPHFQFFFNIGSIF